MNKINSFYFLNPFHEKNHENIAAGPFFPSSPVHFFQGASAAPNYVHWKMKIGIFFCLFKFFNPIFSVTETEFHFEMKSINLNEMEISGLFVFSFLF